MSPETALVFRSAASSVPTEEAARLVGAVRDWPRAFALAQEEAATSAVWRLMQRSGVEVPEGAFEAFRRSAVELDLRMQRLAVRARQTVQQFRERAIPVMLLKGAAHGALFDPSFRSRPMGDLDLLVHAEDVARATSAVTAAGWPETQDALLRDLLKDAHHLPHFLDPQHPGNRLELHVRLMPADHPFAFSERDLWADARPASGPFEGASVPSVAHLVVHASVHFAWQHRLQFGAWKTMRVIAPVFERQLVDAESLISHAAGTRATTCCYWTLRLAARLSGIAVPAPLLQALRPPTPDVVLDALERHFIAAIAPGDGPTSPSTRLSEWLWVAALRPRWSGFSPHAPAPSDPRWLEWKGVEPTDRSESKLARHLGRVAWWRDFLWRTLLDR